MNKAYSRINWQNKPSTQTPIDADHLSRMDLALDTIDDRVIALDSSESGLSDRVTTAEGNITALQSGKVDKVSGKDLSTNDYTTADKTKLAGISAQANQTTVTQVLTSGKEVAQIGIDGTNTSIYADDTQAIIEDMGKDVESEGNPIVFETVNGGYAKELKVELEPIQDLHGYSNPWPAGAGKQLVNITDRNVTVSGVNIKVKDGVITINGTSTGAINYHLVDNMNFAENSYTFSLSGNLSGNDGMIAVQTSAGNKTASNAGNTFTASMTGFMWFFCTEGKTFNNIVVKPMICLSTASEPAVFAPYSNICPISGRTEASVFESGINLWDLSACIRAYIGTNGTTVSENKNYLCDKFYFVKKGKSITLSSKNTCTRMCISVFNTSFNFIERNQVSSVKQTSYTATDDCYVKVHFNYDNTERTVDEWNALCNTIELQLQLGDIVLPYEPFKKDTATTHQYSETIYGGVDDFVNGKLVVTKGYKDLGTLTWTKHSDAGRFYAHFSAEDNAKPSTSATVAGGLICSQYADSAQTSLSNGKISIDATSIPYINIIDLTKSDLTAEQFKTAMDGVQLCYELATPTTIETSAENISLLRGTNVISTDGDNIKLTASQLASITDVINDNVISENSAYSSSKIDTFTEEKTLEVLDSLTQEITKSGNPISLTTNYGNVLKSCELSMSPIQDLHGYSNPWVGGAGKNKLQNTASSSTIVNVTLTVNNDGSVAFNGTANSAFNAQYIGYITLPSGSYIFTDGATSNNYYFYLLKEGDATWYKNGDTFTVDGNTRTRVILYIANNAVCNSTLYPMIRLATVADATFAPYSNICPISGRTEASVKRTGINQWDEEPKIGYTIDGTTGNEIQVSNVWCSKNYTLLVPNTNYYLKSPNYLNARWYDKNKNYLGYSVLSKDAVFNSTIAFPNARYLRFNGIGSSYNNDISINYPSTDTEYHAYAGAETHTKEFGQTVYSGWLDLNSGKLTIDRVIHELRGTDLSGGTNGIIFYTPTDVSIPESSTSDLVICSHYKSVAQSEVSTNNNCAYKTFGNKVIGIKDTSMFTSLENAKTYVENQYSASTPIQIIYYLATPTEIQLTAEEVALLKGNNVLSTNADDMELSYQELPDITSLAKYVQTLEARIKALEEG